MLDETFCTYASCNSPKYLQDTPFALGLILSSPFFDLYTYSLCGVDSRESRAGVPKLRLLAWNY